MPNLDPSYLSPLGASGEKRTAWSYAVTSDIPWAQKTDLVGHKKEPVEVGKDKGRWEKILTLPTQMTVALTASSVSQASH